MSGRIFFLAALFCSGLVRADLGTEIKQQQEIEAGLQFELEKQKKSSLKAYKDIFDFVNESNPNRDEQINRLESANEIWDEFIERACKAEVLETIGTRAEYASTLQCMIRKYKEKEYFFRSLS
jgi:transketolase